MQKRVLTQLLRRLLLATIMVGGCFRLLPVLGQTSPSQLHALEFTTPPQIGLDIVFVPEDYSIDEMDKFKETVETYCRVLLSVSPFSEFRTSINVWRIDTTVDFESYRDPTLDRQISVNPMRVKQFVASVIGLDLDEIRPNDLIIVLVDDLEYGGSGSANVVVAYTGSSGPNVMVHEIGHSFGRLGDEYVVKDEDYPTGHPIDYPNVDWDGSKWKDVPGTGAYVGAWYRNLVRPTYDSCVMRNINVLAFCPVCKRALVSLLATCRDAKLLWYYGVPTALLLVSVTYVKRRELMAHLTRDPAHTGRTCPRCGTPLLFEHVQFCFRCRKKVTNSDG